jgi:hypothetical protein
MEGRLKAVRAGPCVATVPPSQAEVSALAGYRVPAGRRPTAGDTGPGLARGTRDARGAGAGRDRSPSRGRQFIGPGRLVARESVFHFPGRRWHRRAHGTERTRNQVLGYSPIETGVAYLPLALTVIMASGVASNLIARLGFKPPLATGMALMALSGRAGQGIAGPATGTRTRRPRRTPVLRMPLLEQSDHGGPP